MTDSPNTLAGTIRAVIVYQHSLLRDVTARVLSGAGVAVVGAIRLEEFAPETLRAIRPDVVIVDQAVQALPEGIAQVTLFSLEQKSATRVITVGLENTTMVICSKRLVLDATAESLIEAVFGTLPDEPGGSSREEA